jgi:hypothetical protein
MPLLQHVAKLKRRGLIGGGSSKLSHAAVQYGKGGHDRCGVCRHYIPQGSHCTKVVDPIDSMAWCRKFEAMEGDKHA